MHNSIAKKRFSTELIRKWRFYTFVRKMSRKKLELMYKNLHLSYLQMANDVFGEEEGENKNSSVVKEFERFSSDVGMFQNEDYTMLESEKYHAEIKKKYIFN